MGIPFENFERSHDDILSECSFDMKMGSFYTLFGIGGCSLFLYETNNFTSHYLGLAFSGAYFSVGLFCLALGRHELNEGHRLEALITHEE